jgi:hypothetical protein
MVGYAESAGECHKCTGIPRKQRKPMARLWGRPTDARMVDEEAPHDYVRGPWPFWGVSAAVACSGQWGWMGYLFTVSENV